MKKVEIFYCRLGGAHECVANSIKKVLRNENQKWDVQLTNALDLVRKYDLLHSITKKKFEDIYNNLIRKGHNWTFYPVRYLGILNRYLLHNLGVKTFQKHFSESRPEIFISVTPAINRTIYDGLNKYSKKIPYVSIFTDYKDLYPFNYIDNFSQYYICPSDESVEQVKQFAHKESISIQSSGTIIDPSFYEGNELVATFQERKKFDTKKTCLILFGSLGSKKMVEIAQYLNKVKNELRAIFVCGRNFEVKNILETMNTSYEKQVFGYTTEIKQLMGKSDFMIGKPGANSISEAIVMGLPVIVEVNRSTLPHERFNAEWMEKNKYGVTIKNFRSLPDIIDGFLEGELKNYCKNVKSNQNDAVLNISKYLEEILEIEKRNVFVASQ